MCMVLYGYDASTYNSVQASSNWLAWFGLTKDSSYLLGLVNTVYSIGAIISGWYVLSGSSTENDTVPGGNTY